MKTIERTLNGLTALEREWVKEQAEKAGMTVEDWLEFVQKAQIYKNAEERISANGKEAA